ncbi:hypothetical protein T459_23855 [Capsicum annuum]|uniref:Uncharacterized protein n=1 Tax=Capsicum annuum TaxID=4072 RepID=A0A2G2YTI8_CAPAN|nr:hypothetical protein T459_23855 [Capsicum annuum]
MTPQTPQISRYPSLSSLDNIFGSYRPQHFENAPNFTSSPVPMSTDIPDATNNLENLNAEMEDNELDDANNEVNGNDSEDESKGCDTTIQHDELSKKERHTIIAKLCGTVFVKFCSIKLLSSHVVRISWWLLCGRNNEKKCSGGTKVLPNLKVRPIMYEGNEEGLWLHCVKYSGLDRIYECPNPDWLI